MARHMLLYAILLRAICYDAAAVIDMLFMLLRWFRHTPPYAKITLCYKSCRLR